MLFRPTYKILGKNGPKSIISRAKSYICYAFSPEGPSNLKRYAPIFMKFSVEKPSVPKEKTQQTKLRHSIFLIYLFSRVIRGLNRDFHIVRMALF